MFITAVTCYFSKVHLDGPLDMHQSGVITVAVLLIEPTLDWLCLTIPLYIFGRYLSFSSIRFIDVAGTIALARFPLIFAVLIMLFYLPDIKTPQEVLSSLQTNPAEIVKLVMLGLAVIPFVIWTIALMYNAYSVSANVKGQKAVWSFIISLVIAEVTSKLMLVSLVS